MLAQLERLHPDSLRVVYRHFPLLPIHDKASLAAQASQAAGEQGAFWPMHDLLFERYDQWVSLDPEAFLEWLIQIASELRLELARFEEALRSARFQESVDAAFAVGVASGLTGTPTLFLNGERMPVLGDLSALEAAFRLALLGQRQFAEYPAMEIDPARVYFAHLDLNLGDVVLQLYPRSAPLAVNSFIFLAQHGWFDGVPFHQVIPGAVAVSGDPSGTGFGTPGYLFATEIDPGLSFDQPGMVGMASGGPNTNGSVFFITLAPLPDFSGSYTLFGRVVEGLDLLTKLEARNPTLDILKAPQAVIESVTIEER